MSKRIRSGRAAALVLAFLLVFESANVYAAEAQAETSEAAEAAAESTGTEAADGTAAEAAAEPTVPLEEIIPTNATEGWPAAENPMADYVCLMDADTGAILMNKGMDIQSPPASLTKIMTCLLAIENGDPAAQVTMTATGVEYAISGSSNLYTQVGEVFTLKDMLYGVMLKSANDMATQVGEYIGGGSIDNFIQMMNDRAAALGCTNTHFVNACGMPAEGHVSSARDMALISQEALKNETFREIIHTSVYTIPATNLTEARTFQNHHPFISNADYAYEGTIGGKTGYTDLAKSCLTTYVQRDGMTLISVVMHDADSAAMLADTRKILDYGFKNFTHGRTDLNDAELTEGGILTLPQGASEEECTSEMTEEETEDGGLVRYEYRWHGYPVGEAVMTKASYDQMTAEIAAAEAARAAEEEAAKAAAEAEASAADTEEGVGAAGGSGEGQTANADDTALSGEKSSVDLPLGISMNRTAFFAISMLTVLVLLGLILVILSALFRNR